MDGLSVIAVILAGVSWGTAGIFSNVLQKYGFSPFQITSARMLFAAIFLLIFVLFYRPKARKVKLRQLPLYLLSGLGLLGTSGFYYWAMELTSFSTAVVLMYIAPVIVMIVSVLFLGEKFSKIKLVGIVGALLGCCFVTGLIGDPRFSMAGILVGLLSAIAYSGYTLCVKVEMNQGDDPIIATTYCFIFAFLASLFTINPVDTVKLVVADPVPILLFFGGLGFFVGAFPYLSYTFAMRKIPAGVASSMACIEPMTATIVSILFLNETVTWSSVIGIVMILGSVVLLSRETGKKE